MTAGDAWLGKSEARRAYPLGVAKPLDYRRPTSTPDAEFAAEADRRACSPSTGRLAREALGGQGELVAVPAEFDAKLALSVDNATTAAIEAALRHAGMPVFRGRDASARGGGIDLHVRAEDLQSAQLLASYVIRRRERLRDALSSVD